MSSNERFLITGALGCIGAWTARRLVREGSAVVALDLGGDRRRMAQVMTPDELARVTFVVGDISDLGTVVATLAEHGITNVIHLAALQVPFCRADPPLGALVNVVGTVNLFEAVKRAGLIDAPLVYTSSIGAFGPDDVDPSDGRLHEDAAAHPKTHYGVYKLANEGTARVYALDDGVASVGLRPMTVYGVGRDQGLTSSPTTAIAAAVLGVPYRITFGGRTLFQYADDVAATLITASRSRPAGALLANLPGSPVSIPDWIAAIDEFVPGALRLLSVAEGELPFPSAIDSGAIDALGAQHVTPWRDAIRETVEIMRSLAAAGRLDARLQGVPGPMPA
jgi:nucleoside-diphosphate-sugar epimerase